MFHNLWTIDLDTCHTSDRINIFISNQQSEENTKTKIVGTKKVSKGYVEIINIYPVIDSFIQTNGLLWEGSFRSQLLMSVLYNE